MNFKAGKTYRHDKMIDVDVLVKDIIYQDENVATLLVYYIGQRSSFFHNQSDIIKIFEKQEWKKI